jgi:DNA-binding LytR/AlgR family response regulator
MINCYIASQDDSIVNRFAQLIKTVPELRLVITGEGVANIFEGLRTARLRAGILFTCIHELSSINIASLQEICQRTAVILIGGSEQVNKPALDAGAIDYLPRAVSEARFGNHIHLAEKWLIPLNSKTENDSSDIFLTESINHLTRIKLGELLWIEADRIGTVFHTLYNILKGMSSINEVEKALSTGQLVRIHQCYIVNITSIETVGKDTVTIKGDKQLPIGETYRDHLLERLVIL